MIRGRSKLHPRRIEDHDAYASGTFMGWPSYLGPYSRALSALLLSEVSESARADVLIEGTSESIRVDASNSSIAEILAALGVTVDLRYSTSPDLDREITGSFQGPLWHVLARLLEGYDYVVTSSASGSLQVLFVSRRTSNARSIAPRAPRSISDVRGPNYRIPRALETRRGQY